MANPLRVLLVTSWGQLQCGVQAHSELLIDAVRQADPWIDLIPSAEALNPEAALHNDQTKIVHLNYHLALHSRWTLSKIQWWKAVYPEHKIVITMHDTYGESEPNAFTKGLHDLADAFIVHEPVIGLPKAIYWRQAVPEFTGHPADMTAGRTSRPYVGSVGFDFGWKNYDRLCEIAYEVGWGVLLCVPEMSSEREADLARRNPWVLIRRNLPLQEVLADLHGCQATAFLYVNGNSGTSAAIRIGIGARKPVIAMKTCRQFRDLHGENSIEWVETFEEVQASLSLQYCQQWDAGIVALAEQDSWRHAGRKHSELYRGLV